MIKIAYTQDIVDGEDENAFRSFPKPVKLSKIALTSPPRVPATVLAILDDSGNYSETLWEGRQIAALTNYAKLPALSETGDKCKFSQFAITGNVLFFVTSCGQIVEFWRLCAWWSADCDESQSWRFFKVVDLTVTQTKSYAAKRPRCRR